MPSTSPSLSVAVRNAMLNALVAAIGSSPTIEVRTGDAPAASADDSGTLLATFALSATWASSAALGAIYMIASGGVVDQASPVATGKAGHYRLKSSGGTVHISGSVTDTDGDGDLILDTVNIVVGTPVSITSWYLHTEG